MSDYRFTHLTGRVNYPKPSCPPPPCTARTHLSASDINADFYARKLLRNSAPSLCHVLDDPEIRSSNATLTSSLHQLKSHCSSERPSVVQSGRYYGISSFSPTTSVEDYRRRQQRLCSGSIYPPPLDMNEKYSTPSNSTDVEGPFRPYITTRSIDIRTCPGRPKLFQPQQHVISAVTACTKCFNNGKRRTTQVFCPHVLNRCDTFGAAFEKQLFGQYRNAIMDKQFN